MICKYIKVSSFLCKWEIGEFVGYMTLGDLVTNKRSKCLLEAGEDKSIDLHFLWHL